MRKSTTLNRSAALASIAVAGFEVLELRQRPVPLIPLIIGVARPAASPDREGTGAEGVRRSA